MAATAAYVNIAAVPITSKSQNDDVAFANINATTSAFELRGGTYTVDVLATFGGGSITLQRLGPDGSTWLTALTAFTAAGTANATLPPGQYKIALA